MLVNVMSLIVKHKDPTLNCGEWGEGIDLGCDFVDSQVNLSLQILDSGTCSLY